jgi:hypothetical protein
MTARNAVLSIGAIGALVFGVLFVMTWTHPLLLESGLREVARIEVERRVGAKVDALSDSRIAGFARSALAKVDADIARREEELRRDVPGQVARVIADMLDADCECRRRLEASMRASADAEIGRLGDVRERLVATIEQQYAVVRAGLIRDARIVLGTNAAAFLAIAVLAFFKRRGGLQLLIPTTAVLLAVAITLFGYLFKQDWLHTLVYADFTGFAYVVWFGLVLGALLDIALNRGRICMEIVNFVLNAVGSALSAVPC